MDRICFWYYFYFVSFSSSLRRKRKKNELSEYEPYHRFSTPDYLTTSSSTFHISLTVPSTTLFYLRIFQLIVFQLKFTQLLFLLLPFADPINQLLIYNMLTIKNMSRVLCNSVTFLLKLQCKMKVALSFLLKVRLNKILAYFVLKLCLFRVFFFIYFICISLLFYLLFSFLLKRFIVHKDSISPVLTLETTSLYRFTCTKNACEIKEFRALTLQPVELYYILLVFLC